MVGGGVWGGAPLLVLDGEIKQWMKTEISQICEGMEIIIEEGKICKDHIHMCLSVRPKYSPSEVMKQIKGKSSEGIFRQFPEVKRIFCRYGRYR
jgi:putative transposase